MSLVVRPQREDFFPKTRRGHGTTHPNAKHRDGVKVREATPCVDPTCVLIVGKSSNMHTDAEANLMDWCDEHSLSVRTKERKRAQYQTPMAALYGATGGRL